MTTKHPPNFKDWTGHTFGDRRVLKYAGHNGKHALWTVQCKCGQIDVIPSKNVTRNRGARCLQCSRARMHAVQTVASEHLRKHHVGDFVGCFTIKEMLETNKGNKWIIECTNCRILRTVTASHLCQTKKAAYCSNCHNQPQGESGLTRLFTKYQASAAKRKLGFELSKSTFRTLTSDQCFYCGSKPLQTIGKNEWQIYTYNGIDRVDNDIGYTTSNCVTCCKLCNYAKRNMAFNEFINYLEQIIKYRGGL